MWWHQKQFLVAVNSHKKKNDLLEGVVVTKLRFRNIQLITQLIYIYHIFLAASKTNKKVKPIFTT